MQVQAGIHPSPCSFARNHGWPLSTLFKAASAYRKQKSPHGFTLPTTPAQFIPPIASGARHRVYRYQGSLTTAPYTEPVAWIVFQDLLPVPRDLIDHLDPPGPAEPQPARGIQPLQGRLVLDIAISIEP